jgi:hypothetical protein
MDVAAGVCRTSLLRYSSPAALLLGLLTLLMTASLSPAGESTAPRPLPRETAARIDAAFQRSLPAAVDDETFLRRISLDLTGKLPGVEEIQRWNADKSADKRARLIDRLLHSEAYAVNWGRYWRDVVTYHTPSSSNYLRWKLFDQWWTEQFRRNRPWNQVVSALVTASGINDESAPVNYLTALYGNPVEIAATTSRVFLGVQIQCAQCHNAKTEPWKREQFHEFAAFFGRARLVQHKDVDGRGTPYAIESRADGQYGMTDKKDPAHLIPMQPRFLNGESVAIGANDEERRQALARFITSPKNPWFARCYVNRIWSCLLGWGFYPGVADLGGHAKPRYPEVLEILTRDWIASGYDVRWLFETVARTRAYQGRMQASALAPSMAAACPVRLRPEQVFEAMQKALAFDENDKTIPAPAPSSAPAAQRHTGLRNMIYQAFTFDPSLPQGEVQGTIPQALVMMNSVLVHVSTSAQGKTLLADLLARNKSDEEIITALYERVLARRPTAAEKAICLRHVRKVQKRTEALEDVLWSLVNSTEFLLKK